MADYPTEEELKIVREWDVIDKPVSDLLDYIESIWQGADWGFKLTNALCEGKPILQLELHTGGWSGNESIIGALQGNFMFWTMWWEQSRRGGHYYFEIRKLANG